MKKVFILEWNPAISAYSMNNFNANLAKIDAEWINWDVWDWKEAHEGDLFYLIKCGGKGANGIVMQGHFVSDPYPGAHWSGKMRLTYYVDMEPEYMIHPLRCEILTTEVLNEAMPDFQWKGGHSGRILPFDYALKLEDMWTTYIESHKALFDGEKASSLENIG